jgi:hypothetical protein
VVRLADRRAQARRVAVGRGRSFYLLDPTGSVTRTFSTTSAAIQEHLSTTAYTIEGDALVSYFHDAAWRREHQPTLSRSVELAGLRRLPADSAPREPDVRDAIERHEAELRAAWEEHRRAEGERLAEFERALPPLRRDETIALRWRYDGPNVVIERSTGAELWRNDRPWMGKGLYERLRRVAARKYGDRLTAFEVDVSTDEYLRFDND